MHTTSAPLMLWGEVKRRFVGKVFRRRIGEKQETRHVVDCTLGGHVVYRVKLAGRYYTRTESDQQAWMTWVAGAELIEK